MTEHASSSPRRFAAVLLAVWGLYQVGVGAYFVFLRPALLPEDVRFAGTSPERLDMAAPGLEPWLQWAFTVMGGQMGAVGLLVLLASVRVWRRKPPGAAELLALAAAGLLSVGLMSAVNFAIGSDFRWLLLAPVAIWLAAMAAMARLRPRGPHRA